MIFDPIRELIGWPGVRRLPDVLASLEKQLTDRARAAIRLAEQEARRLNHEYLGTEHLLYGLVNDNRGIAAAILQELTGNLDRIRSEVNKSMMPGPASTIIGTLAVTPRLRKTLGTAQEEAILLHHDFIGSEHLLLGLLADPEGVPAAVFAVVGFETTHLRQKFRDLLRPNGTP